MTQSHYIAPSAETHIPEKGDLPDEPERLIADRPDAPTPSLWQRSVKVKHKLTGEPALVQRIDWGVGLFRAYYTERLDPESGKKGVFATRTQWESCSNWDVETTFAPHEIERQVAAAALAAEYDSLSDQERALVLAFCDDPDPNRNVAKLQALRAAGLIKSLAPKTTETKTGKK